MYAFNIFATASHKPIISNEIGNIGDVGWTGQAIQMHTRLIFPYMDDTIAA